MILRDIFPRASLDISDAEYDEPFCTTMFDLTWTNVDVSGSNLHILNAESRANGSALCTR